MQSNGKPLHVLGISAFYHDAAAALTTDGRIVAAAQQERFSRKKHDPRFPSDAIQFCLEAGRIEPHELAAIAFYDNPVLSLERVLETVLDAGAGGRELWLHSAPGWLSVKLFVERLCRRELGVEVPVLFSEHHFSHAASAFYPSPFDQAAILTIDGVGEWATTTLGVGTRAGIEILQEIHFPHSLGLLYSAFTQFCGFKVNSGEYKLMGLAPYGRPIYAEVIRRELIDVKDDGSYRLNPKYFGYTRGLSMTNGAFHDLFGGPPRPPESRISRREMDLAASIQQVTEEVVCGLARHLRQRTGLTKLCLAGGVALNCVANGRLLRQGIFEDLWIQPAAGDAGGSVGAALMVTHEYFGRPCHPVEPRRDGQRGSFLGPAFTNAEIRAYLDARGYAYHECDDAERARLVAAEIARGKVVGYLVGRMEFGPRALGARSILGDPRNPAMQSLMNRKIKFRESFRPFAPSVLRQRAADYFELDAESPYMLLVAPVRAEFRRPIPSLDGDDMIPVINQARSTLPAITHVDFSARVQTVDARDKPDYYQVLCEFEKLTGAGVLVNTSFNVRGEPIVCSPHDAYTCFMRTDIDMLVLENCVLYKHEQPRFEDREDWRAKYELD
jgi:carbamoyltransferase